MLKYIISITVLLGSSSIYSQLSMVWYNVENAFDTIDDPAKWDEEYTPQSSKEWVSWKYWSKLNRVAKVLRNSTGEEAPDIICLGEIENNGVLYDLSRRPALKKQGYRLVHYESPDLRGIDVGLLYKSEVVNAFASRAISVLLPDKKKTRDILLVSFETKEKDTIHLFLNHWPSRRGGQSTSNIKRVIASERLIKAVDSLELEFDHPNIIITGDFNDGPENESVQLLKKHGFELLMEDWSKGMGTHRHAGEWEYLDQWIVSPQLRDGTVYSVDSYIYYVEQMVRPSSKYPGIEPRRSWAGHRFVNGYSDHLPIVLKLTRRAD
ncbi:endonuclease/exonuclease/phosphatase family protein [Phaeocystidibacter luteus]|uniref:Endonuclease n=1 Tax=Phaeocystidibacter luteus TaxID=911197 RepID=A0A6N6RK89_9FLAO|nr:endonuclease/exonuclease/phosphatase family protein [Phaeocystidibacter luteus]KAB2809761.1 endonuclease [Phaeocystidibacter luteus]